MKKSIIAFSLAIAFVLSTQTQAAVQLQLQTPSGLAAGDTFRFIFLTQGTITGTSADISTYDTFVNSQAGGAQYQGSSVSWSAIISTPTINARDHVGDYGTNFPVFRIDGTRIANSMTTDAAGHGLWGSGFVSPGAGILASPSFGIDGAALTGSLSAWTGSDYDGTKLVTGSNNSAVGSPSVSFGGNTYSGLSMTGSTTFSTSNWLRDGGQNNFNTNSLRVYGISEQLTVIPEPSSLGLLLLGAAGLVARRKR
jgi:hypothetical protein